MSGYEVDLASLINHLSHYLQLNKKSVETYRRNVLEYDKKKDFGNKFASFNSDYYDTIGRDLVTFIADGFSNGGTRDIGGLMSAPSVSTSFGADGSITVIVSYSDEILERDSLYKLSFVNKKDKNGKKIRVRQATKEQTGSGVYDIIGLFTHGWKFTPKSKFGVWGYWNKNNDAFSRTYSNLEITHAKTFRPADPFVMEAVRKLKAKYPNVGIDVTLPELWIS